jgi:hypothetical protein
MRIDRSRGSLSTAAGLLMLGLLACQAAARILPTAAPPAAPSTPSPAPTRRPTPTPTPRPDISALMVGLADLPKGFKAREFTDLDEDQLKKLGMTREDFFLFENEQSRQFISGYRSLLADGPARQDADFEISDQASITDFLASWVGATDLLDEKLLNGFENVGDTRMPVSFAFVYHDRHLRVDGVVFRRGSIYVLITIEYTDGYKPVVKLKDLAATLDQRILEDPAVSH